VCSLINARLILPTVQVFAFATRLTVGRPLLKPELEKQMLIYPRTEALGQHRQTNDVKELATSDNRNPALLTLATERQSAERSGADQQP
jgi:hypothetical protein